MGSLKVALLPRSSPQNYPRDVDAVRTRCGPRVVLEGCGVRSGVPEFGCPGRWPEIPVFPYLLQWGRLGSFFQTVIE